VVDVFWDDYVFVLHGLYQRIIPISIYALFIACTVLISLREQITYTYYEQCRLCCRLHVSLFLQEATKRSLVTRVELWYIYISWDCSYKPNNFAI